MAAYNENFRAIKINKHQTDQIELLTFKLPERSNDKEVTTADFNPATGRLTFKAKARGMGDCGMYSEWVWTGAAFTLTRFDGMKDCMWLIHF